MFPVTKVAGNVFSKGYIMTTSKVLKPIGMDDGIAFDSDGTVDIKVADGLKIDSDDKVAPNLGNGLTIDNHKIVIDLAEDSGLAFDNGKLIVDISTVASAVAIELSERENVQ